MTSAPNPYPSLGWVVTVDSSIITSSKLHWSLPISIEETMRR